MILATRFTFIVERRWKNMYFYLKLAWPPAAYDVISRNHSNWPSLNLSQSVREGWMNSYWKRQVLMFYPLGENSQKPYWGHPPPLPPPCIRVGVWICVYVRELTRRYTSLSCYWRFYSLTHPLTHPLTWRASPNFRKHYLDKVEPVYITALY